MRHKIKLQSEHLFNLQSSLNDTSVMIIWSHSMRAWCVFNDISTSGHTLIKIKLQSENHKQACSISRERERERASGVDVQLGVVEWLEGEGNNFQHLI